MPRLKYILHAACFLTLAYCLIRLSGYSLWLLLSIPLSYICVAMALSAIRGEADVKIGPFAIHAQRPPDEDDPSD